MMCHPMSTYGWLVFPQLHDAPLGTLKTFDRSISSTHGYYIVLRNYMHQSLMPNQMVAEPDHIECVVEAYLAGSVLRGCAASYYSSVICTSTGTSILILRSWHMQVDGAPLSHCSLAPSIAHSLKSSSTSALVAGQQRPSIDIKHSRGQHRHKISSQLDMECLDDLPMSSRLHPSFCRVRRFGGTCSEGIGATLAVPG